MREWSEEDEAERQKLLAICKEKSGEYLPAHHGKGSWATTYSTEFVIAAAELWRLYKKNSYFHPAVEMSRDFQSKEIRSCRGATMTVVRVEYLYNAHLRDRIKRTSSAD